MRLLTKLFTAAVLFVPAMAFAHPGHDASGVFAGLSHPLTGLDHLLAMLAVGLWASQQKGNLRWALPVTFVAMMLAGGWLGFQGLNIPYLETGIATSVLALGLLVSVALRPPVGLAVAMTALFAMAHGVAHGLELPAQASPWSYATGFVCATAALHALGYAAARALSQAAAPLVRLAGMLSAAAGVWLLAGA
ncbi:HupE/UreJ family protein [Pseudomonas sp. PDM31]|uniref:HupE/UreJ family protein n=1 Tax=Pseudomonas sp. PDM31 TaxID=2854778 RepID=UPI001C437481|nr:HupE/UreJ family protein [Pseudomonas sp. PDM31]MBV7477600.1 HupE/UreJ family protein [Pseudomonas sp. PDM31]